MSSNPLSINPPPGSHISSPSHPSAFPSYACPPFLSTTPFRGPLPFGSLCNRSLNIASMSSSRFELCSSPPPSASSSSSTSSCRCAFCRGDDVGGTEDEDEEEDEDDHPTLMPERWDVVGPGQAMVDFSSMVDDEFLEKLGLDKGTRKVVNHEERGKVLGAMDGCSYKAAAGGSLSNSLVALARLGNQPIGHALSITMAGSVGSDPLGGFIGEELCKLFFTSAQLRRANVRFLSAPVSDGTTGTVIVLTTPDAQRTMLAYQGTSSTANYDAALSGIVSKTNVLVGEGYLFELPDTIKTIKKACEEAHRNGALVAITASDVSCIEKHYDDFWEVIGEYADIVLGNSDEARALCDFNPEESPVAATSGRPSTKVKHKGITVTITLAAIALCSVSLFFNIPLYHKEKPEPEFSTKETPKKFQ
ncbi:hypothetical protein SAY86_028342 [Trapa natans]|uniref:Carbohydrate kinase PfkB domain-containing protein n=1 Tax=Trapa natans TaxID=22666 RepID=A0AAN7LZ50_TRANT|nr:hypothetical protein SAY86_028342 [Trapa natans]